MAFGYSATKITEIPDSKMEVNIRDQVVLDRVAFLLNLMAKLLVSESFILEPLSVLGVHRESMSKIKS